MNRSKPGQPVSITTAVQRFNQRKYGDDGTINANKRHKEACASSAKKLSPVASESTRRLQKFQSRNRKNTESKIANKLPGADIPKITRELTFFLPNSWDYEKPGKDNGDTLQKPEPVANSTIHVTEVEINVSKKEAIARPTNTATFRF